MIFLQRDILDKYQMICLDSKKITMAFTDNKIRLMNLESCLYNQYLAIDNFMLIYFKKTISNKLCTSGNRIYLLLNFQIFICSISTNIDIYLQLFYFYHSKFTC